MKKRTLICCTIVLSLLATILAGCGPAPTAEVVEKVVKETVVVQETVVVEKEVEVAVEVTPTPEPVELNVWTEFTSEARVKIMDEWIAGFQEEYPWITVVHRGIDNEVWGDTLRTAMLGGDPPDLFVTGQRSELMDYVDAGLIYDLTNWYDGYSDRFIPGYDHNAVIRGRRYAIPWEILVLDLIWYNPSVLEESGIDATTIETWDDLMAACETLKENGEVCFAFGGGGLSWTGGHWVMLLLQNNLPHEDILKLARGEKKWTDPDVVAALSHFEELVKAGYLAPGAAADDRNAGQALFFQGEGAFWQAGSWHLFQGGDLISPDWESEFIPFPNFADAQVQDMAISSANLQWTVSSQSKHIDESLLFLEYITRLENSEDWVKSIQGFVTRKGAVNENTAGEEMVAIAEYLESHTVVPLLEVFFSQEVIQSGHWAGSGGILSGQITTEEWAALIQEMSDTSELVPLE